jgi:hypothetical protein
MKQYKQYIEQEDTSGMVQMNMRVNSSLARWPLMWFAAIFKSSKLSSSVLLKMNLALEMNIVLPKLVDIVRILLPFSAFFLWSISLQHEDIRKMNDLGMVSTFPPLIIISLIILTVSFCLTLRQPRLRTSMLLLHLVFLILMLYGRENLVEEAPRFAIVYRHAGYTEYIMRTGSVNPNLDAYFSWPGFFVLAALVTQLAGYHDILSYAGGRQSSTT